MGDREKENVPQQIDKDKTKQQASDDDKERLNSGKAATDNNLKLAALFREKLLLDESKEPSNSSNCARRSRSKTRNGPSRSEACPNQDTRIPRQSKLRKSRPRSNSRLSAQVCNQAKHKRSDPVALYQYYQNEWSHFRDQIPGENSHTDLRWEIRHKLIPK